jgi:hypothetical protein
MGAQKMRYEVAGKESDEHFNTIWSVISTKQEWRVKASTPALTASNEDMDRLDDNTSLLIKDRSPPLTGMDINMDQVQAPQENDIHSSAYLSVNQ